MWSSMLFFFKKIWKVWYTAARKRPANSLNTFSIHNNTWLHIWWKSTFPLPVIWWWRVTWHTMRYISVRRRWMAQRGYGTIDVPWGHTSTFDILAGVREVKAITGGDHWDIGDRIILSRKGGVGVGETSTSHLFRLFLWSVTVVWMLFHV